MTSDGYRASARGLQRLRYSPDKPIAITFAELFLVLILIMYFLKIVFLGMAMSLEEEPGIAVFSHNLWVFLVEGGLLFLGINALLGMSSHRPSGWKKAVRSSVFMFLASLLAIIFKDGFSAASQITLKPEISLVIMVIIIILMATRKVREYYTPPLEETRPIKDWVYLAASKKIYPDGEYEIVYPEDVDAEDSQEYEPDEPIVSEKR